MNNRAEKIAAVGMAIFLLLGEIGASTTVDSYAVVYVAGAVGLLSIVPLVHSMYKAIK